MDTSNDAATRGRESRQQGGDTYTLEIAFPAVKYVPVFCTISSNHFIISHFETNFICTLLIQISYFIHKKL